MILLRATRIARLSFVVSKPAAALILLNIVAVLTGCNSSHTTVAPPPAELAGIAVGPPDISVAVGLSNQFTATGLYSDGSKQDITSRVAWSSANSNMAMVSNTGLATTLNPGSTTITATLGAMSGSTSLNVTAATLVMIDLTPTNASVASGLAERFVATGVYTDNSVHDISSMVTWSSSATGVASVSNASGSNGLVSTSSPGSTIITAALGGLSISTPLTVTSATLVSIGVTPANPSIASGLTDALQATGVYTDHSTHDLTNTVAWNSSADNVVSVSNAAGSKGLAVALSTGSATITASFGGVSGSTSMSVSAAALVSLGVTPANTSIANGLKSQFTAIGTYTDNSTQVLTTQVAWSTSDSTLAVVSNASGYDGLATALAPGSVTVTATLGGVSASTTLTVTPATLVSIGVTPANPSIANGLTSQFVATGVYTDNSTQDLTTSAAWMSSNTAVASISNAAVSHGLATGVSPGSVTITAATGSVSGSTSLTVTPATLVSIAVIPANSSIAYGTALQFAATGTYTDNSTQPLTTSVTWSSSDITVASISNASGSNGLATSTGQGSATITAALGTVAGVTGLTVTPAALVSIAVTPANPSIFNGTTLQFTATGTYTDNSTQNLTASATWASSGLGVATISNAAGSNGLSTAIGAGATSISAAVGAVTSPAATLSVTADPQYAYAANQNDNTLSQYTIGAGGVLTANGVVPTGAEPNAVVEDLLGRYVYVANWVDGTLSEYTIGSAGALTGIGTVPTGGNPASIAIDPTSSYVYVANLASSTVSQYTIGAGGALTPIGTLASGNGPACITVDPTGPYVYAANQNSNTVSQYTIGAGGVLTLTATIAAGNFPQSVAVDPTGRYAYVANYNDGTISQYAIGAGGALAAIGTIAAGALPESLAVDPTGHFVYAANHGDNTVSEYHIGTGGVLAAIGTIAAGSGPWFINIDATGRYVYVANFNDSTVSQYAIGAAGALIFTGTVATGGGPNAFDTGF
jgi:DNA-binding beta-propeller fold protein YncE/urocanate hydratase